MASPVPASFAADKAAILSIARAKGCNDVAYIDALSGSYNDLLKLLNQYAKTFDCDPAYLDALLAPVDESILESLGVYRNKNVALLVNPTWIINCIVEKVVITSLNATPAHRSLEIVAGSQIALLQLEGLVTLGMLTVTTGAVVSDLNAEQGSIIESLHLKNCGNAFGTLAKMTRSSNYQDFAVDSGANFGGMYCKDPEPATDPAPPESIS